MVIKVLVEISSFNIDKTFYYKVPLNLEEKIKIGIRVLVPFSVQTLEGFVLGIEEDYNEENIELRDVIDIIDEEVILTDELLELGKYISEETLSTLISSYQVMLPRALKAKNKNRIGIKKETFIEIDNLSNVEFSDKQQEIINLVKQKERVLYKELKNLNSSVDTLIKNNVLKKVFIEKYRMDGINVSKDEKKVLTVDQSKVCNEVINHLHENIKYLLYGVTGSGKTEVYMEIIEKVIESGRKAIVLVPEITLTNQIRYRFYKRFERIAILHSLLSDGEKYDEYRRIKEMR